jgi:hypothetical protein
MAFMSRPSRRSRGGAGASAAGVYVDATFGRGGHARAILARLGAAGRLVGIDRDPAAEAAAVQLEQADSRFVFRRAWFSELPDVIKGLALAQVDGVLLDLGISSPQIDDCFARLFLSPRWSAGHADGPVARRIRCGIPCPRLGARTDGGTARLW